MFEFLISVRLFARSLELRTARFGCICSVFFVGCVIAGLIYAFVVFHASSKGVILPMSTHTAVQ